MGLLQFASSKTTLEQYIIDKLAQYMYGISVHILIFRS